MASVPDKPVSILVLEPSRELKFRGYLSHDSFLCDPRSDCRGAYSASYWTYAIMHAQFAFSQTEQELSYRKQIARKLRTQYGLNITLWPWSWNLG